MQYDGISVTNIQFWILDSWILDHLSVDPSAQTPLASVAASDISCARILCVSHKGISIPSRRDTISPICSPPLSLPLPLPLPPSLSLSLHFISPLHHPSRRTFMIYTEKVPHPFCKVDYILEISFDTVRNTRMYRVPCSGKWQAGANGTGTAHAHRASASDITRGGP